MNKNTDSQESPMERFFRLSTGKEPQSEEFKKVLKKVSENKELVEQFEKLESNTKSFLKFEKIQKKLDYTMKVTKRNLTDVLLSTDITPDEVREYIEFLLSDLHREAKIKETTNDLVSDLDKKRSLTEKDLFDKIAVTNNEEVENIRNEIMARFAVEINSVANEPDDEEKARKVKGFIKKFQRGKLMMVLDENQYKVFEKGIINMEMMNVLLNPPKSWVWTNRTKILFIAVIVLLLYILFK